MKKALCIIKKYPPPMIIPVKETIMKEITHPIKKQAEPKDVKFCPIWIRKFF